MLHISGDPAETISHVGPAGTRPFPAEYLRTVKRARWIIEKKIKGKYRCDEIFSRLDGGRTFSNLINHGNIWLNYDPSNVDYGWFDGAHPRDIVITRLAIRMGRWSVAGTIVHEMAHLNGAPGGVPDQSTITDHAAEETLKYCGLRSPLGPYDAEIDETPEPI